MPLNKKIFNDNLSKLSLLNYKIYESLLEFYNIMEQVNKGYDFLNKYEDSTQQKEVAENLLKAINNGIKKGQKALQCLNE